MSLFQCENCGCVENTALSCQGIKQVTEWFDWAGIEERKGLLLCSACAPTKHEDGTPSKLGVWHGQFSRRYLPKGLFKTNRYGDLEHIENGDTDFNKYVIAKGNA